MRGIVEGDAEMEGDILERGEEGQCSESLFRLADLTLK